MAELTKQELQAAEDRAEGYSLADDDVALQTSNTMPERFSIKGQELQTAGSEQHGPVFSFTRKQVRQALDSWGGRGGRSSGSRSSGSGTRAPDQGRQQVPDPQQTEQPKADTSDDTKAEAADGK